MDFNLKGGVLIIGSLYWQDHLTVEGDYIRKDWRNSRLDLERFLDVNAPIKYGRFSKAGSYTMIFDGDLSAGQFGVGKFCPFKKDTTNWDDLHKEATLLSVAEGMNGDLIAGDYAWSVCGILFNPKLEKKLKEEILEKWREQLSQHVRGYKKLDSAPSSYSMNNKGEFDFPWPDGLNDYDFLIGTASKPKFRQGVTELTVDEISNHVPNRHYFLPNRKHSITTYQDDEILEILKGKQ